MSRRNSSTVPHLELTPAIILVEPQLGENIGAAARAMLNCGLTELRLVRPRDGWPNPKAASASAGADSVVENAQVYRNTRESIADLHLVFATTARARDMVKPVYTPTGAAKEIRQAIQKNHKVGILFGRERSGLTNHDVMQAQGIITAPLNPAYSSLNLGQSVLLIAWEFLKTGDNTPEVEEVLGDGQLARQAQVQGLIEHLNEELDVASFYRSPDQRPAMQQNLHNIFSRARLTEQETKTLRGVVARLAALRRKISS